MSIRTEGTATTDSTPLLANPQTLGMACGKVILVGEHSAVDGFPAIALPLKSQTLQVRFGEPIDSIAGPLATNDKIYDVSRWNACWSLSIEGREVLIDEQERARLTKSLALAYDLMSELLPSGRRSELEKFAHSCFPLQRIYIESKLPLGAGMGGSAALSAALIRALNGALGCRLANDSIARLANELDGVFHGRASGLDAATVVSDSVICFEKAKGSRKISNLKGFWLLLIDTGDRTSTRDMVRRVAELRERDPQLVTGCFKKLGALTLGCELALEKGELLTLGSILNEAHTCLQSIDVSTPRLDACVHHLRHLGALGAKLTGGGGGGLALGIFENPPDLQLNHAWSHAPHFLTFVPADKSS